ncbi:xylulokinase [Ideonella azotifigens]|uniref:Xylulose kinase n=1 Tax=Ideonella azotifigens TaxID=513160 RepID=A0ABP3VKU1_9BURK|nr:xylulokinase [Ideonella azotifigens]MCD2342883.1 xylulokinase [Ideonella azotifigens]
MFIGMDLGTSELKLLLLDERHQVLATASEPLQVSRPQPLWSEQAPGDWWTATDAAMARLAAAQPEAMRRVRAIGLSGQMHGAVVLDANDMVLRPAILWNDGRSGAECEWLMQTQPQLPAIAGNLAMPGFTAPKLVWLSRHEPALFERIASVLLPKDWLRLQLTGDKVSDMSDAAGTLWLDVARRDWSDELLAACGLSRSHMPRLVEGSEVSGRLRLSLAQRWGLPADVLVAGGGGDNAASAVGIGAVKPGQGFLSLGTSGVLFVCNDRFRPNPSSAVHAFCHALPGRWHQMSVMLSAASCLAWAAKLTGQPDVATLLAQAATLSEAEKAAAPLFLPYLSGERTPHNNPHASGSLTGLTHEHGPAHIAHAVMEGVAFGLRDGWRALAAAGTEVGELSLVGGGARSALWAQMLASTLDLPLVGHAGSEAGGALGAARLGWLAAGGDEAQVCIAPPVAQRWLPDPAERERLLARYARFTSLYPALHAAVPTH